MSTATLSPTLDVSSTPPIPFSRLVKVEVRKMGDTKAGLWLLVAVGAISVLVTTAFFIWGSSDDRAFLPLLAFSAIPLSFFLPVLGILLITSEWGQRTALVTFTMTPHRGQILWAKVSAAVLFLLASFAVAASAAALLALVGGADDPWADVSPELMSRIVLGMGIGIIWGLAFGAVFLNSAGAIVSYFVVPIAISIVTAVWTAMQDKLLWFDLNTSSGVLFDEHSPSGQEWAQIGTGLLIWIVIPGAIGASRILRSEVK